MRRAGGDHPTDADGEGSTFTFEKGVTKNSGGAGFADVWKRGYFALEYKSKHKNLDEAYQQLLKYREALESPPLLVVCDLDRFEIHTNWTNTSPAIYSFCLQDLLCNEASASCTLPPLEVLRALFFDPGRLKPGETTAQVTTKAATEFAKLANSLRSRGVAADRAGHYIMRLLFCLFSEDIGLLPGRLFTRLIEGNRRKPAEFVNKLRQLFAAMSKGGSFGADDVPYFDGGLFMDDEAYDLTVEDLGILSRAAALNWAAIEPAIFGTLFERILDPDKRSQIGAHYTSKEDILLVVEPVLMEPLRKRWQDIRQQAGELLKKANGQRKAARVQKALSNLLNDFATEIASIRVLDPACGSGNFLYVSLKRLLDLEKEVSVFASSNGLSRFFIRCRPSQLYGIESNVYAHEVASVAVWIGFLQWQRDNGIIITDIPIMQPLENIRCADALLDHNNGKPTESEWNRADTIIGNPPFLGGNKIRQALGDEYVNDLFQIYGGRVPAFSDLVCYWFEKARAYLEHHPGVRVGLLATNSIRGGANRKVLEKIKTTGNIFWAQSDRGWVLDGANVRVSMVAFDSGKEPSCVLDGIAVRNINSDLSAATDTTTARQLPENENICFMGPSGKGPFDISQEDARQMLKATVNVNGRRNSDVVRPVNSGIDLVREDRNAWTIDFGLRDRKSAAQYEKPFQYVLKHVHPIRSKNRRKAYAEKWWLYAEPRPGMRKALAGLRRYIATPAVSKHRVMVWISSEVLCNQGTLVFARDDDYFFGVLQSRVHDVWALKLGTSLEDRPRYTPTSTFETFPLPFPPNNEPSSAGRKDAIANAARELVRKRDAWLRPPGASEDDLRKRTLTQLYNENPTWLKDAHRELDNAVLAAYGWSGRLSGEEVLVRLLRLNAERYAQHSLQFERQAAEQSSKKGPASVRRVGEARKRKAE